MKKSKIRIILADDHTIFRQGLLALLNSQEDFEVVAEASHGREAIAKVAELKPDLVIIDIGMPELNGIEATKQIMKDFPRTKIIVLTMHNDKRFILKMLQAGANGYLLKDTIFEDLVQAIQSVHAGQSYLSPKITSTVIEDYLQKCMANKSTDVDDLTPKEREVLQLLAEGFSSKEIAAKLFISVKTVENHRKHIIQKLDVHNIAEPTKYAIRHGLTGLD